VVVKLLVYWVAEEYAEVLGEQAAGGRLPSRASIQGALVSTWPMVTSSYPAVAGGGAGRGGQGFGADGRERGLVVAAVLLTVHGWLAGGPLSCGA
jgi:hypothetical protein